MSEIPDDIKAAAGKMARMIDERYNNQPFERLGHLVTDEVFTAHVIAKAVLAERERCAQVAEHMSFDQIALDIANDIRSGAFPQK